MAACPRRYSLEANQWPVAPGSGGEDFNFRVSTREDFNNDPNNIQCAVIGDRTGGADHKGIFDRAMDQLNLLQPEFVINVGDLIEGYSRDETKLAEPWDQIDGMLAKLDAWVDELGRAITVPHLSLHGTDPGREHADWLRARIADATVEVWPDQGHYLHLIEPDRFVARVVAFDQN